MSDQALPLRNPYRIEGPACISFSGGRSSGYMLAHILEAHGGRLPDDVHVCFMNTGKEMPQSLEFVAECGERWGVKINWLEFDINAPRWTREVSFATASRDGRPYEELIRKRKYLPNAVSRFCTTELKVRRSKHFMLSRGYDHWDSIIGIRRDEPRRIAKIRAGNNDSRERWTAVLPMAEAGASKLTVLAWWAAQPFELLLPDFYGQTPAGNCDLCFLKARGTIMRLMREDPAFADWWIAQEQWTEEWVRSHPIPDRKRPHIMEARAARKALSQFNADQLALDWWDLPDDERYEIEEEWGRLEMALSESEGEARRPPSHARFRKDWPTYERLRELALMSEELPFDEDDEGIPRFCGD